MWNVTLPQFETLYLSLGKSWRFSRKESLKNSICDNRQQSYREKLERFKKIRRDSRLCLVSNRKMIFKKSVDYCIYLSLVTPEFSSLPPIYLLDTWYEWSHGTSPILKHFLLWPPGEILSYCPQTVHRITVCPGLPWFSHTGSGVWCKKLVPVPVRELSVLCLEKHHRAHDGDMKCATCHFDATVRRETETFCLGRWVHAFKFLIKHEKRIPRGRNK